MKKSLIIFLFLFFINPVFAAMNGQYKQIMVINFGDIIDTSSYDKYGIPKIKEGTRELLEKLHKDGQYDLVLYTVRKPKDVENWLMLNNIGQYFKSVTTLKYPAQMYSSNRVVPFNGSYNTTNATNPTNENESNNDINSTNETNPTNDTNHDNDAGNEDNKEQNQSEN